jgi:hypothetical protein
MRSFDQTYSMLEPRASQARVAGSRTGTLSSCGLAPRLQGPESFVEEAANGRSEQIRPIDRQMMEGARDLHRLPATTCRGELGERRPADHGAVFAADEKHGALEIAQPISQVEGAVRAQ